MAKKPSRAHWKSEPDEHDFPAATEFLSLLFSDAESTAIVEALLTAPIVRRKAKDLLRASRLDLLARDDAEVAKDLEKVARGEALSPVLVVRGRAAVGLPLIVADGYHRICASHHLGEDVSIPCRLADMP